MRIPIKNSNLIKVCFNLIRALNENADIGNDNGRKSAKVEISAATDLWHRSNNFVIAISPAPAPAPLKPPPPLALTNFRPERTVVCFLCVISLSFCQNTFHDCYVSRNVLQVKYSGRIVLIVYALEFLCYFNGLLRLRHLKAKLFHIFSYVCNQGRKTAILRLYPVIE